MLATHAVSHPEALEAFRRSGFYVARSLFGQAETDRIRAVFMEEAKNGPVEGLSDKVSHRRGITPNDPLEFYPRMLHPHRHGERPVGPLARRYMLDPRLYGYLCDFLADEPVAVQSMFYFKPPGARGQALHQDNLYLRVRPGTCMAAWIAIDDADEDNGGMVVVPGSDKMDIACPEETDFREFFTGHYVPPPPGLAETSVPLKAGDVLFFNGSLIHGSYRNTSPDRFRRSLICHYAPASTAELASFYSDPTRFDGTRVEFPAAQGGGPCGIWETKPH